MAICVGVDAANLLRDRRGIGRYVRTTLATWRKAFADRIRAVLLVPHAFPSLVEARLRDSIDDPGATAVRRGSAARSGVDVVWYPWNGMTWKTRLPSVVTIHDLWPFVSPSMNPAIRARERRHYELAAWRANRFIAVSRFTAGELTRYLHIDPSDIDVVPHGVGPIAPPNGGAAAPRGSDRYVLFVGEDEPRKNLLTLVSAVAELPERLRATTALVIAGRNGTMPLPADGVRISVEGEVSDARLAALYSGASAFVFPSRYEGFGLPVLEAMYYGAPVIATAAAAIPEAAGEAALTFEAGDTAALTDALARVLSDRALAQQLSAAGRARAAEMSLDRCAERTLAVFERVVGG